MVTRRPCFPRDNVALSFIARALETNADLAETTDVMNRGLAEKTVERLRAIVPPGTTVAVLGLAYKPFSHVVEESQGIYLCKALSNAGARVVAWDPLANEMARAELRDHAVILDSVAECLAQAEVVLITTPDPAFESLDAKDFTGHESPVTVVDFWRILSERLSGNDKIRYVPIGRSVEDQANSARMAALWNGVASAAE